MTFFLYAFAFAAALVVLVVLVVLMRGVFFCQRETKEGLSTQEDKKEKEQIKKHLEFLNQLIVRSDPTPDGSGDYTSDTGVEMIQAYLKTLPATQRMHPMLSPYLELLRYTTETAENDKVITDLKKLIIELSEKEEERLSAKKLAESAKKLSNGYGDDDRDEDGDDGDEEGGAVVDETEGNE